MRAAEGFRPVVDILRLLGEKVEKKLFARPQGQQKSWQTTALPARVCCKARRVLWGRGEGWEDRCQLLN
jgi:hypothetical protein